MDRTAHLSLLRRDAAALLAASERGLDADVPSCPRWTVERLVGHVGRVYRMATGWLRTGAAPGDLERPPAGPDVRAWTARGLDELVAALEADGGEGTRPTWAGEQPATFWPRRMAIETALHRWDAQAAHGAPEPVDAELAVDAIDELFDVMVPARAADALRGAGETLHLHATDVAGEWLVTLTDGPPQVERAHAKGDVAVRGPASDLLLLLWNRGDEAGRERLQVFGDADLLDRWSTAVRI
ncbi:MAG TPA: maleylpyruvate isomerase family mycothiol-dependent enzyme [Acidimicrobiales bacterium]